VGVLSTLTTVLIGWQVIDYFCLKRNVKKLIEKRLDALIGDYHIILDGVVRLNLYSHNLKGDCALLTDNCFECLSHIGKCKDKKIGRFAIDTVMDLLYELCIHYKDSYSIYKNKKSLYLYVLSDFDNPHKKDIAKTIDRSSEIPDDGNRIDYIEPMSYASIDKALTAAET